MRVKIALGIEYHGTAYHGWQKQPACESVQETLEQALSVVAGEPIEVHCAGRTDAGVHAIAHVVHFDTHAIRADHAWMLGGNMYLPPTIRVKWAKGVPEDFHARFKALKRRYHYWIYNAPTASAILYRRVTWHVQPLDENLMQEAVNVLLGEHDFSSFRGRDCQASSPIRTIYSAQIKRHREFLCLDICADGFLHHMVRNIVGVLFKVGNGKEKPDWTATVLASKDRTQAAMTAPPDGLYLANITYPDHYHIPYIPMLAF